MRDYKFHVFFQDGCVGQNLGTHKILWNYQWIMIFYKVYVSLYFKSVDILVHRTQYGKL